MKLKFILFFIYPVLFLSAQNTFRIQDRLHWKTNSENKMISTQGKFLDFDNAVFTSPRLKIPSYRKEITLPSPGILKMQLLPKSQTTYNFENPGIAATELKTDYDLRSTIYQVRNEYKAIIELVPVKSNTTGNYDILNEFEIDIQFTPSAFPAPLPDFTFQSVLSNGEWHKISIKKNGIYKLDKSYFEKNLKLQVGNLDPRNIHIYGNGGTPLPESTDKEFIDDLMENAIYFKGEEDGKFDDQDFILFYANGPDAFSFDPLQQNYSYIKNPFSTESFYFIKIDNVPGKRITTIPSASQADYTTNLSFDFKHYQQDLVNLLDIDPNNQGSGKNWYGNELSNNRELNFGSEFIFDNIDISRNGKFAFAFAGRAPVIQTISAIVENKQTDVKIPAAVFNSSIPYPYANHVSKTDEFKPVSDLVQARLYYQPINNTISEGWIDFFQVSVWKNLVWNNKVLYIMDPAASNYNITEYRISNTTGNQMAWEITNPTNIKRIETQSINNLLSFRVQTLQSYRQFLLVDDRNNYEAPQYIGSVGNQNLHGMKDEDMIIIYPESFKSEAERLQNHRSRWSNIKVTAVELKQVYNEFSSGSQDPTAVRNMMRMLYQRNSNFKYLLLFGDGTYDLRYIDKRHEDQNIMITYETDESLDPIDAFPADDYYGLLDPSEGKDLKGMLDINIGRLCAKTPEEAKVIVDKIIRYDSDPKTLEDWKLNIVFSADDEDGNVHFSQAERIAESVKSRTPLFNQEKIYLDAFEQVTTPGGERYPEVNKAYANAFFQGSLVINYLGHGGYTGLAQERVLQNTDIRLLENYYKLPLVIVATCTFNGFDDPKVITGGEEGILNSRGGFLALFSTVRAVYSSDNFDLTNSVYKYLFEFENGYPLTMGEIMRRAKNDNASSGNMANLNTRKFFLFGDPSQKLAIPILKNAVLTINDKPLIAVPDTFRALETVNVKGQVINQAGVKQSDFSGKLYATVFDKEIELRTKGNDPGSNPTEYSLQRNIIYKGSVEVKQGDWEFTFIIPKDINYEFGKGKMSLYSTDEQLRDAAGFENGFIVGGVSNDSIQDDNPPLVKVFMNNDQFVSGGICDPNPILYSQISDDFGINISGNSIGHDLTAVIDQNTQSPIILNQVYKSKLNNPKEGELYYPLKNLSPGKHTLTVTAWDISNNSGQGSTEFYVIDPSEFAIDHILNYPNPFSSNTEFQFESNLGNVEMNITIHIQSISGKVVKTIEKTIQSTGYRITGIQWDGKDDFGSELANGVYLYRLSLRAKLGNELLQKTSDFHKLLILK